MEEALDYCFRFVRHTATTWLALQKNPEKRLRFQKLIFEESVEFSDEGFGNAKLTPIYALYREYLVNPSSLVTLRGWNWNQILWDLVGWHRFHRELEDVPNQLAA